VIDKLPAQTPACAPLTSTARPRKENQRMRQLMPEDFPFVTSVVDAWWGGRPVRHLLPKLFFEHFTNTSFAVPSENGLSGFLIGFQSQAFPSVAYIHLVGVSPEARGQGIGRSMHSAFFAKVRQLGCTQVRCITSPVNVASVAFHRALGFESEPSESVENGFPVVKDHAGSGHSRVLFTKLLHPERAT